MDLYNAVAEGVTALFYYYTTLFAFIQKDYLCNVFKKSFTLNGQKIDNRFSTDFCPYDGL